MNDTATGASIARAEADDDGVLRRLFSPGVSAAEQRKLIESFALTARDVILITEAEPIDQPGPRIVFVNPAFTQMTGYSAAEVIGKTPRILQGSGTDRAPLDYIRERLAAWEPFRVELLNYRKNGTPFWVEIDAHPLANETGFHTHWIAIQRDISARKEVEQQLAAQLQALAQVSDAVIALDNDWRITYWNREAERMYKHSAHSVMGKVIHDVFTTEWVRPATEESGMRTLARDGVAQMEQVHRQPGGRTIPVEGKVSRLRDANGEYCGYIAAIRDISDRKRLEAAKAFENQFVREVLHSMTGRRLRLVDNLSDLPTVPGDVVAVVPLRDTADLKPVREALRAAVRDLGFAVERTEDTIIGIHEAVMNAIQHANGGTVSVYSDPGAGMLQVWIGDVGTGIARDTIHRAALEFGFTTGDSMGFGFPLLLAMVDRVWLLTGTGGTTLVIEQEREAPILRVRMNGADILPE